nr:orotate phosphoribosyltransferase [Conexibacter sp. DBS9H8]
MLRSGQTSTEYFDKYQFEAEPVLLRVVGESLLRLLPADVDALAGLELGGIPLVTILSQLTGLPAVFVRKKPKEYGTCRLAEGGEVARRRLVIVEDVVSTGGAIIDAARELRASGAEIIAVLSVIDRESGGTENLAAEGLELRAAFTWSELVAAGAAAEPPIVGDVVGLDHVQLAAPSGCEEEARRFFGELLGLPEIEKPPLLRGRGGVWFALGSQQLHIGVQESFAPARKAHPALRVTPGRLDEMAARLSTVGAPVSWDEALPECRRFYTEDPWGNRIELLSAKAAGP